MERVTRQLNIHLHGKLIILNLSEYILAYQGTVLKEDLKKAVSRVCGRTIMIKPNIDIFYLFTELQKENNWKE